LLAWRRIKSAALIFAFYALGVAYYCSSPLGWSVPHSIYFISISITTVGFGDFYPDTAQDRLFTMAYVSLGLYFV